MSLLRALQVSAYDPECADITIIHDGIELQCEARTHHIDVWENLVPGQCYRTELWLEPCADERGAPKKLTPASPPGLIQIEDNLYRVTGVVEAIVHIEQQLPLTNNILRCTRITVNCGFPLEIGEYLESQVIDVQIGNSLAVQGFLQVQLLF